jgi:hypothetical protein
VSPVADLDSKRLVKKAVHFASSVDELFSDTMRALG